MPVITRTQQLGDEANNDLAYDAMRNLIQMLFRKEIVKPITTFRISDDAQSHIARVLEYIHLTNIQEDKEMSIVLMDSLDENIQKEMAMEFGYAQNKENFQWLKEKFLAKFEKTKGHVSKLTRLFQMEQHADEKTSTFASRIKVQAFDEISFFEETVKKGYLVAAP